MNNKISKTCALIFVFALFVLSACDRFPLEKIIRPTTFGTPNWGDVWCLYTDAIRTRGLLDASRFTNWGAIGAGEGVIVGGGAPYPGNFPSILFDWNGAPSSPYLDNNRLGEAQTDWVGFGFEARPGAGPRPRYDFTAGEYTRLEFWVQGNLWDGVELLVETGNENYPQTPPGTLPLKPHVVLTSADVTSSWTMHYIDLINDPDGWPPFLANAVMRDVEFVVVFTFINTLPGSQSNGARISIANIRLTRG